MTIEKRQNTAEHSGAKKIRLNSSIDFEQEVERPQVETIEDLIFQQIEIQDFVGNSKYASYSEASIIRMFGVTGNGNSVLCNVHGFNPYFFVYVNGIGPKHLPALQDTLNLTFLGRMNKKETAVLKVELVQKNSIYGYQKDLKDFLKVTVRLQSMISLGRRIFKEGFHVAGFGTVMCQQSYESNIPFVLRFMIDKKV
jgi:DNA polymerase delta subunit 1